MNNPFRSKKGAPSRDDPRQGSSRSALSLMFVRFSVKDQTLFAKRLSFLIKAGVPLSESMHMIHEQAPTKGRKHIFATVLNDVRNGQFLSTSLQKFPRIFGSFTINLIRVGEQGGVLSSNLAYLAEELEKKRALKRKVLGAMVYPIFISVATILVTSLLTVYIFPKLMPIFTSLHVDLPLSTRILIGLAAYLRAWGILTFIGIIAFIALFIFVRSKVRPVRYWTDRILLLLPLAGSIACKYNLTNFSRTLGLLLRSGVRLTEAITITADTTTNLAYREAIDRMAAAIYRGEAISKTLEREKNLFPDMLTHMIEIGERTGNLSTTLTYLAELYESEVEDLTKSLSSAIEPALMIIMGIMVGMVAVSVITPIYSITQHLNPHG